MAPYATAAGLVAGNASHQTSTRYRHAQHVLVIHLCIICPHNRALSMLLNCDQEKGRCKTLYCLSVSKVAYFCVKVNKLLRFELSVRRRTLGCYLKYYCNCTSITVLKATVTDARLEAGTSQSCARPSCPVPCTQLISRVFRPHDRIPYS